VTATATFRTGTAERSGEGAAVGVAVQHEVGPMSADWRRQS